MRLLKAVDKLSSLPPLRDIINQFGLRAEKSLGQNFILDQNLTDKIVRVAGDISKHHVIEIGPGPGGLTRSILQAQPKTLHAIEYDRRAIEALQSLVEASNGALTLHNNDALRCDVTQIEPKTPRMIIANLPYNIATPLLIGWLKQICEDKMNYDLMILMFQKEVAERIIATPNTKAYGRLSIMSQWLCDVSIAFDLPPSAFVPPPKVTSSIVLFQPKKLSANVPSFSKMEQVTAAAFNQRRKMIRSSLKNYQSELEAAKIDGTKRAEDLSVDDFIQISRQLG